jgi:hypothetical protein
LQVHIAPLAGDNVSVFSHAGVRGSKKIFRIASFEIRNRGTDISEREMTEAVSAQDYTSPRELASGDVQNHELSTVTAIALLVSGDEARNNVGTDVYDRT